jgi:hypothetical protein
VREHPETEDKFHGGESKQRYDLVRDGTAILSDKFYDSYRARRGCAIKVVTRFNRS